MNLLHIWRQAIPIRSCLCRGYRTYFLLDSFSVLIRKLSSTLPPPLFLGHDTEIHKPSLAEIYKSSDPGSSLSSSPHQQFVWGNTKCRSVFHRPVSATCTWSRVQHPQLSTETPEISVSKMHAENSCKIRLLNLSIASSRTATSSCHHTNLPKADASFYAPPSIVILIQHYLGLELLPCKMQHYFLTAWS